MFTNVVVHPLSACFVIAVSVVFTPTYMLYYSFEGAAISTSLLGGLHVCVCVYETFMSMCSVMSSYLEGVLLKLLVYLLRPVR